MSQTVGPAKLHVWKLMEFAGVLSNKKRRALIEELEKKFQANELGPDERRILAAHKLHPQDKRARRKFLRQELKSWEKRTPS